jgi:hypothetical protein
MHKLLIGPLLVLAGSASANIFDNCQYTAPRSVNAATAGVSRIVIIGRAGSLRVNGRAGAGEVRATGTACVSGRALLDQTQLVAQRSGSELRIEAVVAGDTGMFQHASLDFEVSLPNNIPVTVRDGSGELWISNTAELTVDDGSGALEIRDVAGNLDVTDGSGEMTITHVTGDVRIVDESGSITVEHVGGSVTIPSDSSGSVDIHDVKRNVTIESKGSGSVFVADVGGDFHVGHKGSGGVSYERVAGHVEVPSRR